jgi:hypothetical protein
MDFRELITEEVLKNTILPIITQNYHISISSYERIGHGGFENVNVLLVSVKGYRYILRIKQADEDDYRYSANWLRFETQLLDFLLEKVRSYGYWLIFARD